MPAMNLDFVRSRRAVPPLAWALLGTGLLMVSVVALDWRSAQDEWASVEAQAARQQQQTLRARPVRTAAPTVSSDTLKTAQRIEAALNRPWGRLLSDLETLSAAPVALVGLEAQAEGRLVRLTGEARQMSDVVDYVARLRSLPSARGARLVSHEIRRDAAVEVLRFSVDLDWRVEP